LLRAPCQRAGRESSARAHADEIGGEYRVVWRRNRLCEARLVR
jgi:hypothetical protein